jgi:hypothetical protein
MDTESESPIVGDPYFGERAVLDELRRLREHQYANLASLDQKLQLLFEGGGLLIALAATVKVAALQQHTGREFWILASLALCFYLALGGFFVAAMRPSRFEAPVSREWEQLDKNFFGQPERAVLLQLAVDYQVTLDQMAEAASHKARILQPASVLFMLALLALLGALWLS